MKYLALLSLLSYTLANNWETYPEVPKTATINGFADPIYDDLPKCAQECVKVSTGNTPCPEWDTGCLCVMPQWSGLVAKCVAEECQGEEVNSATSLAYSLCSSVGANLWLMPASVTSALTEAAGTAYSAAPEPTETGWDHLLDEDDRKAGSSIDAEKEETETGESEETGDSEENEDSEETSSSSDSSESTSSDSMGYALSTGLFTLIFGSVITFIL